MDPTIAELLTACDAYRRSLPREISEARLSTILFDDGKKLASLRSGSDIGVRTLARTFARLEALKAERAQEAVA